MQVDVMSDNTFVPRYTDNLMKGPGSDATIKMVIIPVDSNNKMIIPIAIPGNNRLMKILTLKSLKITLIFV